ncbi:MAG: CCA tRNA nucleotidyltransferase [Armatimonadota bacterium]
MEDTLRILREATRGTEYEGRLYLVGGYVRDKLLGRDDHATDLDLVLEGDATAVARLLWERRVARHHPVTYPAFGTAMVHVGDAQVELVTARDESYRKGSRKPQVRPGTLLGDARRRDFTVNTLLCNLHDGEILDPLGTGRADLAAGLLRTPLDPEVTFVDDPLRMLRACRLAAKLGFAIAEETLEAIRANAFRLDAEHGISWERIRDEFVKTLLAPGAIDGLERMRTTGLLERFAPELAALHGCGQNGWHRWDVWEHSLRALEALPGDASLVIRLATLLHDIGKPATRSVYANGKVHFFEHETIGAGMARALLTRLRFDTDTLRHVERLVSLHMRYGAVDLAVWGTPALRRLVRTVGEDRETLFVIARADIAACGTDPVADLDGLERRLAELEHTAGITRLASPLSGGEIMRLLGARPGPLLGKVKAALVDAVVAGELAPDDLEGAEALARRIAEDA